MKNKTKKQKLQPLIFSYGVTLGCDPEFFFTQNGQVIGSEKVLPKAGIEVEDSPFAYDDNDSKFIVDGVQAELNPAPNTCRANLANEISRCFRQLAQKFRDEKKDFGVNFAPCVDISQAELDTLSDKSKVFGCAPSKNVNFNTKKAKIKVDPRKYLKRSAGGHIHLGSDDWEDDRNFVYDEENDKEVRTKKISTVLSRAEALVPILDLVVANTCVLLDRDPSNVERRKNYGRVGEYRKKEYGLEYRTLSNFWLRAYPLMSFVMGLCRQTVHMVQQSRKNSDYVGALLAAVPREDVIKAVQNNDFALAYKNFKRIEKILVAAGQGNNYDYPFSNYTIENFHHFVKRIRQYGLDYWFDKDSFSHWCKLPDGHDRGWEAMAGARGRIGIDRRAGENGQVLNKKNATKLPRIDLNAVVVIPTKRRINRPAPVVAMED